MTAYVILSRLRSAMGLLLLRAFAPDLFRMGPVPGPFCLMKLLRARLSDSSTKDSYTCKEARQEYSQRIEEYETWRARRRAHGTPWVCPGCKLAMPAEEYGAKINCADDLHRFCLAPGQWRKCNACTEKDLERTHTDKVDADLQYCNRCFQMREDRYFTSGVTPLHRFRPNKHL